MPLLPSSRRSWPATLRSLLPLLALLLTGQVLLVPSAAQADPAETLVLDAPAYGKTGLPAAFGVTLTEGAGTAEADAPVALQRLDTAWTTVTSGRTGTDGRVTLSTPLPVGWHSYRAVRAADGTHPALTSTTAEVKGVRLASVVTVSAATTVVDERRTPLSVVWRASDGTPISGTVTIFRRLRGEAWATYTRVRTAADGTATLLVMPRVDSVWRATGTGASWWLGNASPSVVIDNVPPVAPVDYPAGAPQPAATPAQGRAQGLGANAVVTALPAAVWRSMVGRSWHRGCPVGRSGLRLLRVNYWGFDGYRYRGEMVLAAAVAGRAGAALREMYNGRFPIRRMYRVDRFGWSSRLHGADDYASMGADNTSGFNCRSVVNRPGVLSPHARGRAIDVNTWENPYRSATGLVPDAWWASRSHPRIAWRSSSHPVVRIWNRHGFRWTYGTGDSQHVDGRRMQLLGGFTG